MTYTTPPTVTSADQMTAAFWNTYITDNLETIAKPPAWNLSLSSNIGITKTGLTDTVTWTQGDLVRGCTWSNPSDTVTIDSNGWYRVGWCFQYYTLAGSGTVTIIELTINGTVQYSTNNMLSATSAAFTRYDNTGSFVYWLETGDDLSVQYRMTSSGFVFLESAASRFYGFQIAES